MTGPKWLRRCERGLQIFASLAAIALAVVSISEIVGLSDNISRWLGVAEVQESARLGGLDPCEASLEVALGESCSFEIDPRSGSVTEFRVVRLGAYPPGATSLRPQTIKLDWDAIRRTFQAVALDDGSGAWRVEAAGPWVNLHNGQVYCTEGDQLGPGQFCVEGATGAQFRVYGSDQLNPDDVRDSFDDGYAVLYWFDRGTPSVDNGLLGPNTVELRCPGQDPPFVARRVAGTKRWVVERADGTDGVVCAPQTIEEGEISNGKGSGKD